MLSDIEIIQNAQLKPISEIGQKLSLTNENMTKYGDYMAKIDYRLAYRDGRLGKLILVTGTNPGPAKVGKTTVAIGLADAIASRGKNACVCLREPLISSIIDDKIDGTGSGYSQVVPTENIKLHFTGDTHAIESANNLLSTMIEHHIAEGNELKIDPDKIIWRRCVEITDPQLKTIKIGEKDTVTGFDIASASEIMSVLCLSRTLSELKDNLGNMVIGYTKTDKPVYCRQLHMEGAMTAILKDAFNPNLVQTLEGTPAIIHGSPMPALSTGCNSIIATKTAMSLSNFAVTEAEFGSEIGAEKFIDIICPRLSFGPDCIVIVTTVASLKHQGGGKLEDGLSHLGKHICNMEGYNIPVVVAINAVEGDLPEEYSLIGEHCENLETKWEIVTCHDEGEYGARALANTVIDLCSQSTDSIVTAYGYDNTIIQRANELATTIYGASAMSFTIEAAQMCKKIEDMGLATLPICVAKTELSFSDNAKLLGSPENFIISCVDIKLFAGAGLIVLICGGISTMPDISKKPKVDEIDVDIDGNIMGLA